MQLTVKSKGSHLSLDPNAVVGAGGEAKVFAVDQNPHLVAKVYHNPTQNHAQKLAIMLANPPGDPMANQGHISIAWPVDLLQSGTQDVVGFLMPCVKDMNSILNFYNPQVRHKNCPLVNYQYLHRTARNLATAVGALHKRGYVIGDLNESNILVSDTSRVTMVDTDSFQVTDPQTGQIYRCPVGKPEFTPPELQGYSFADIDRQPQHDQFGLAVLIFQLLMEGFHPFTGIYKNQGDPPPIEQRIASGHFPYSKKWRVPYDPSPVAPDINILHPDLKWLFFRCFENGHKKPKRRPDADAWISALEKAENELVECAQNEQHIFGEHLRRCPWCERAQRLNGKDPFPSMQAIQQGKHLQKKPKQSPQSSSVPPASSGATSLVSTSKSSIPKTGSGKLSKKWLFILAFLFVAGGIAIQKRIPLPNITLPKLPKITLPDLPNLDRITGTKPSPQNKPQLPKAKPIEPQSRPSTATKSIEDRFRELGNTKVSISNREQLYEKFIADFRHHPDADYYLTQAKSHWEEMSFAEITKGYEKFKLVPHAKLATELLRHAQSYLKHHAKRSVTATQALQFAKWHLSTDPHPLTLYVDQEKKLYVKVIHQGTIIAETKGSGRFTAVSIPKYKSTDSVTIEGYQDDRFEDTNLKQTLTVNSSQGNHHLKISDKRGNILIQAIYEDFPGAPKF